MGFIHRNKAKRVEFAGYSFPSKLEGNTFLLLRLREKAGEIKDLRHQDTVYLTRAKIKYIADFTFWDCKRECFAWAEAKGIETPEWRIKRNLWEYYGPGPLEIYFAKSRWCSDPFLKKTLIPETIE